MNQIDVNLLDKDSEVLEPRMKNIGNALFKDK